MRDSWEKFSHKGLLFLAAFKGLVIFLARDVSNSIVLPQSLIKFLPLLPWMYTWSVWSVEPRYIVCWLSILRNIFFSFSSRCSSFLCVDSAATPQRFVMGAQQLVSEHTYCYPQQKCMQEKYACDLYIWVTMSSKYEQYERVTCMV